MNVEELHQKILYPVVRVRAPKAAGSGTFIYCKPDPDSAGDYLTFALTNWHVIESAIEYTEEWDSLLKRKRKKEVMTPVSVEVFDYVRLSEVVSSNTHQAEVLAYDQEQDLAVLKLDSPKEYTNVTQLIPEDEVPDVKLFTPCWTSGCSLAHDPFANPGYVTYLKEIIKSKLYWMTNANSIFGNSGGAVFHADTGDQLGVTARITGMQLGFGFDIITWMGFFIPPQRIYEFLKEQELLFLFDPEDTYAAAVARRDKKEKESLLEMLRENGS